MSRGMQCYVVRPDALRAAIGSADAVLVERVHRAELSSEELVQVLLLIDAETPPRGEAIFALPRLCEILGGHWLGNNAWSPYTPGFRDAVDQALKDCGISGRVNDLPFGFAHHATLGVEATAEALAAGYTRQEVEQLREQFSGWEALEGEPRTAVAELVGWFDTALAHDSGLVIFDW